MLSLSRVLSQQKAPLPLPDTARRLLPAHGRRAPPRPRAAGPGKAGRRAGVAGPCAKRRVSEWGSPASGLRPPGPLALGSRGRL